MMANGRGRASRSKGCATCRKRKVKCDERQPTCYRCEKSNHECLGYSRPLIIIRSEGKRHQVLQKALPTEITSVTSLQCNDADLIVHQSLHLDGFQEEIFICHLLNKLYKEPSNATSAVSEGPGLSNVLAKNNRYSPAYAALLSVGQAFFGRVHGITDMVDESRGQYVKALNQIREELALSDLILRGSMQWYTCLWGCSFLGMYEMICSSSPTAWIQHSCGMAALVEAAGPQAFQSPSTKVIFYIKRSFIAVGCIARRKRTFLERDEWQTIPWANSIEPKSIGVRIQDMLCCLPGLMEDADAIEDAEHGSPDRFSLQARILNSLVKVDRLRAFWNQENPNARYSVPPRETDSPFQSVYHFQRFDLAAESIHLDVIALLLYGLAEKAWLALDTFGPPTDRHASQNHAFDVCRSIEYMMESSEHESLGSMVVIFPLRVAINYVESYPMISNWLRDQLERLSGQKGFGISARVMEV